MRSLSRGFVEGWKDLGKALGAVPVIGPLLRSRFAKFGTVGFAGTLVNLLMLYLNQEVVFQWVHPAERRLRFSLGLAIFVSTVHNYLWNRSWTWRDRRRKNAGGFFLQMAQYFLSCALAIGLQYLFTLMLVTLTHYLVANVAAIVVAAVITYLLNDMWTFAKGRIDRLS